MPQRAIFLAGVVGRSPLVFGYLGTLKKLLICILLKCFCTNYKEPCRPFSPFTFRCVHGCPVAQGTRTFAPYFFDVDTPPLSLFCCLLLFRRRRSSRAFWSSFDFSYPHLVCFPVCLPICCTQNTFGTMHHPQSLHDYQCACSLKHDQMQQFYLVLRIYVGTLVGFRY